MDKSVLISIRPKWCNLICNGKKTIELRKTRPNLETPFTVYIYCTKDKFSKDKCIFNGKVIGEFICDRIDHALDYNFIEGETSLLSTCLTDSEIIQYLGNKNKGYFWHISNLILYDFPVELSDFGVYFAPQSWCYVHGI